jgi:hypothetical protein
VIFKAKKIIRAGGGPLCTQCPLGGSTFFTSSTGTLIFLGMGVRHFPEPELL